MHPTKVAREMMNLINDRPLTSEEWLALLKKWEDEMTIGQAAVFLGISRNEVSKISGPKYRKLARTRHGHVSTRSVYAYRERLIMEHKTKHATIIT